mmetsp:Transcript_40090/g.40886  ORF Transcript_40090/g.40886 Transcript_40090/m.40886 type:complete len:683 (-) Transcript_40090:610-2658(-)
MSFALNNGTAILDNDDLTLSAFDEFQSLSSKFGEYHKDPVNVVLHLITTPLGCIGFFSIMMWLTKSTTPTGVLCLVYLISLLPCVSLGVFMGTALVILLILASARSLKMGVAASLAMMIAGYLLQDLAHIITGEETFQSTYSAGGHVDITNFTKWSNLFTEHVYYLIPLCIDITLSLLFMQKTSILSLLRSPLPSSFHFFYDHISILAPIIIWAIGNYCLDTKNGINIFPGFPYYKRVVKCTLVTNDKDSQKSHLQAIREWAMSKFPPHNMSSHWWFSDLPEREKNAFETIATCNIIDNMFRSLFSKKHYCVDVVEGMNEVYVTGPSRMSEGFNSDQIFYTKHVDGPWGLIPFVSVYRCIVGMDKNYMTHTHFPMTKDSVNACEGEVIGFDFNREVHYITRDETKRNISDEFRVVLKLHYCVYPRILAPLGWLMHMLNVKYNQTFRALFLKTINPQTYYEHFLAWNVVINTTLFNNIETYIGQRNVLYLASALALWWSTGQYVIFLVMTSFIHYLRYIGTYYYRQDIDYGSFKRDVLLFKSLALLQLFYHYFSSYFTSSYSLSSHITTVDYISISMILSGYIVSIMATNALGIERTYFGSELGLCEAKWITQFPYGYIPHPMIVSQIWALLGVQLSSSIRTQYPYLIPLHITLYTIHMIQEHFDIYKKSTGMKNVMLEKKVK